MESRQWIEIRFIIVQLQMLQLLKINNLLTCSLHTNSTPPKTRIKNKIKNKKLKKLYWKYKEFMTMSKYQKEKKIKQQNNLVKK